MQEAARAEAEHSQQALAVVEQQLEAAHGAHQELAAEKERREAELVGRLAAMQQECGALLAVVERAEEQHAEVGLPGSNRCPCAWAESAARCLLHAGCCRWGGLATGGVCWAVPGAVHTLPRLQLRAPCPSMACVGPAIQLVRQYIHAS